jgi:hypothetical protein
VSAERSLCCSLGTFKTLSISIASLTRFAVAVRFLGTRLVMRQGPFNETIKLLLRREDLPNPATKCDQAVPVRIPEGTKVSRIHLWASAELTEVQINNS